jgi:glycosyltransferase involved in cell wall biosynthesis
MTKKKILVLSDHPLSPSGVGTQTKYMIESLLETGRYQFVCFGGAMKHEDYTPTSVEPWGPDWKIFPVDGYGNEEMIRSVLRQERPDALWFMTDPRFYGWLWEMENEIRAVCPMIYYHVWDNYPAPMFNGDFYRSTDEVVCISKVTHDIVQKVAPKVSSQYLPHAVNDQIFKKLKSAEMVPRVKQLRDNILNSYHGNKPSTNKKLFFWNNRNARRKQSGTIVWWFKEFLDEVGHDKATLVMHTDARDPHGQDLPHLIEHLGVANGQIMLSTNKVPPEELALFYNAADYTINISDAEGFGLATLESLSCGTPIIVCMTGGLQEQVTNGTDWFGWGIHPASKTVIGSLQVPYIYEDRMNQQEFTETLKKALKASPKAYKKMSIQGMKHVSENYSFNVFKERWVKTMDEFIEKNGSWDNRKNYNTWHLLEVA